MSGKVWWLWSWIGVLGCCLPGCDFFQSQSKPVSRPNPRRLLTIPTAELLPVRRMSVKTDLQLPASDVTEIRISLKKSSASPTRYRLFRREKAWWVVRKGEAGAAYLALFPSFSAEKWLGTLKGLKPLTPRLNLQPKIEDELLLESRRGQPLLRMMRLASKQPDDAWPGGSWQLYRQGALFQQLPNGDLSKNLQALRSRIAGLGRRGKWIKLPEKSWGWTAASLFRIGSSLETQRQHLKSCFKKRKFPSHVGLLKIQLHFGKDGLVQQKAKETRIRTRVHTKYNLVWCIWNKAKRWKLKAPIPEFDYFLLLPPRGP